jgi:molybdopterin-guanine dinucleotide biosynthesis protein A
MDPGVDTAVVVLAGGEGRRIGGGKPQRRLGGRSLIERALGFAGELSPHVALSVRVAGQGAGAVPELIDDPQLEGPLAGIGAALRFAEGRGLDQVLTLPCDSPFLPADLLVRLGAALAPGKGAAIPSSGGRLHPICGLWRREVMARLADYAGSGRRSLHGFAEFVGCAVVEWSVQPVDPFFNVNSEEDLRRAERMLRLSPPLDGEG